jgi:osmotically-inducible protein OsmY
MSIGTLTTKDVRTRDAVLAQLAWEPQVDASRIGVVARDGAITLTGWVDSCAGKLEAERAAKRVHGVRAVANELEVKLACERTDSEIAIDVARALELRSTIPDNVKVAVHHGHVTLTGQVRWLFQKSAAEKAAHYVRGVRRVVNYITIVPRWPEQGVRQRIVDALQRNANLDARDVTVSIADSTVTLTGSIGTWLQREWAERAAADAPGVAHVDNRLAVTSEPPDAAPDEMC